MYELGGCLADDMGLGKTIQTLALLAKAREKGEMQRALVVCPVSTLGNWAREVRTFTPHFTVCIHSGPKRARTAHDLEPFDIILVGYATMRRDVRIFRDLQLDYLILDEAQVIKNPKTKRRKAAASIQAPHRPALIGSAVQGRLQPTGPLRRERSRRRSEELRILSSRGRAGR
ncbi:MAG: SNF2-related protein [Sediminispirochaetaceae bacterium]